MHTLILPEDFDLSPSDPKQRFAFLEERARERLFDAISNSRNDASFVETIERIYVGTVNGLLSGMNEKLIDVPDQNFERYFNDFLQESIARSTRYKFESLAIETAKNLSQKGRLLIENAETSLREAISISKRSESEKAQLSRKLDELIQSLKSERSISANKAYSLYAAILIGIAGTTTFMADAPSAWSTLTNTAEFLMQEAFDEDENQKIGQQRTKLLAPPSASASADNDKQDRLAARDNNLNDEIPF